MGLTATNVTLGPGTFYVGAFGATEPADTAVNAVPQASAWTDGGGTMGGVTLSIDQDYKELEADQVVDTIGRRLTKREFTIKTNLVEPTLANVALALNASTPVTGTGFASYDPPNDTSATSPNYKALIFDGIAPAPVNSNFRRRFVARKCLSTEGVELTYSKDDQTVIPVTFIAHFVSSSITPFRIVDQTA